MHIGIILDGNRRWAKARNLHPWQGHRKGAEAVKNLLSSKLLKELKIDELTLYSFSMQNFKRTEEEKAELFKLIDRYFKEFSRSKEIKENKVKVRVIGRTHLLPQNVQETIKELEEETKDYDQYKINFALAYGGREELIDAVNKIIKSGTKEVDETIISKNLYLNSDPDFIIRTSGEMRTSNFLIWQASYSEWFFLDKPWPDFTAEDLKTCVDQYNERHRRFGK